MSLTNEGPEAQNALFDNPSTEHVPANLVRATARLQFPPSYVLVGVYRLLTDKNLYKPAWDKCRHATRRGAIVGATWVCSVDPIYQPAASNKLELGAVDIFNSEEVY
jgi:hypothetical protein